LSGTYVARFMQTSRYRRAIRRLFLADANPAFALDAELSVRSSVGLLFLGLPFLIPHGMFDWLDKLQGSGMYKVSVVTFFMFNVKRSLGECLASCFGCLRGLIVAVIHTWILHFFFPSSVTDDAPWYALWVGVADGVLFISTLMILNLNAATKIVAISNFIGWWMLFLKPGDDSFHFPLSAGWDPWRDAGLSSLMTTCVGSFLAISGCLFPYPLLALDNAKDSADELVHHMAGLWTLFVDYLGTEHRQAYAQDRVYRNLRRLEKLSNKLGHDVDHAWWECLGLGRRQRVRRKLRRLDKAIKDSYDCIYAVWAATQGRDWGDRHNLLMALVTPQFRAIVDSGEALVTTCVKVVVDGNGVISDDGEKKILNMIQALKDADEDLLLNFKQARRDLGRSFSVLDGGGHDQLQVTDIEELALPHVLAFNVSAWAHVLVEFARRLVESKSNPEVMPQADVGLGVLASLVDGVTAFEYRNYALRTLACLFVGFAIGYNGYKDLVEQYESRIAGTVVILVSKFTGSAVVKNLRRIQGVVLGMVFGQIVKKLFMGCDLVSVVPLGVVTFLYALVMVFVVHSSEAGYADIGKLAAIFGVQHMLIGKCSWGDGDIPIDKQGAYDSIVCNVIACMLIALFDEIFYPGRAADSAYDSLQRVFTMLEEAIGRHFDKSISDIRERNSSLAAAIDVACDLNEQAANEPRFWRTPWRREMFDSIISFLVRMRYNTRCLECCMADNFMFGGKKGEVMRALLDTKSVPLLADHLLQKIGVVKRLSSVLMHETVNRFPLLNDEDVTREFRNESQLIRGRIADELSSVELLKANSADTMREDAFCRITVTLVSIETIFQDLREMQHLILRNC